MNLTKNKKKQMEGIDFTKSYKISDAVKIIKGKKYVKFDESLEVSINTGIDSKPVSYTHLTLPTMRTV